MYYFTALDVKGAHGRVKRKDREVSLAVEDEVAAHGVDDRPVLEDLQRDVAGVDILQGQRQSIEK